jgi:SAM-dependent methyltransferase
LHKLIRSLYHSKTAARVFHTLLYCLKTELADCESVLDLGCGPDSPVQYCGVKYTVGVEAFGPYYERAVAGRTHTRLVNSTVQALDFDAKSFDAVVLVEVIEHLPEEESLKMLEAAERWARKKVIVTSPNGFVAQSAVDSNPLQEHLSGWPLSKMRQLGFRSRGLAGLKALRRDAHSDTMGDDLLVSIRFRPRLFWFAVATLSQIATYYIPAVAFGLFSVKSVENSPPEARRDLGATAST